MISAAQERIKELESQVRELSVAAEGYRAQRDELDAALTEEITNRDYWEEKATELSIDIGKYFDVDFGGHSNMNCPVQNAIDYVWNETNKKE